MQAFYLHLCKKCNVLMFTNVTNVFNYKQQAILSAKYLSTKCTEFNRIMTQKKMYWTVNFVYRYTPIKYSL